MKRPRLGVRDYLYGGLVLFYLAYTVWLLTREEWLAASAYLCCGFWVVMTMMAWRLVDSARDMSDLYRTLSRKYGDALMRLESGRAADEEHHEVQ
jgi:hypothetical protein